MARELLSWAMVMLPATLGRRALMMDVLSLGLTVVFFALSVGLISLCDRL